MSALGVTFAIRCADAPTRNLIRTAYRALAGRPLASSACFSVEKGPKAFVLVEPDGRRTRCPDVGTLLAVLDDAMIVGLQRERPDLAFLHAAALQRRGGAVVLAGLPGAGKSTLAWALTHHRFAYMSDELAPLDPRTLQVHAFPRALCLKTEPPPSFPLPGDVQRTPRSLHVPLAALPVPPAARPARLAALFILEGGHRRRPPSLEPLGTAPAAVRLYPHLLNALSHTDDGLDVVLRAAAEARCFLLRGGELAATAALVARTVEHSDAGTAIERRARGGRRA